MLGIFQIKQAEAARKEKEDTVAVRLSATWCHAIAPLQPSPTEEIEWDVFKLASGDLLYYLSIKKIDINICLTIVAKKNTIHL